MLDPDVSDDRKRWERRYAERLAAGGQGAAAQEPSAFLVEHLEKVRGRILDVAAGTGRNTLFLARQGRRVDAVDISFTALQSLRRTATREKLAVNVVQADLQFFPLPVGLYDAVLNIRYLQRSLFGPLVEALRPGGILLFETFIEAPEGANHTRNPAYLLRPGELRGAFRACETLAYEEGTFATEGGEARLARLLARRTTTGRD